MCYYWPMPVKSAHSIWTLSSFYSHGKTKAHICHVRKKSYSCQLCWRKVFVTCWLHKGIELWISFALIVYGQVAGTHCTALDKTLKYKHGALILRPIYMCNIWRSCGFSGALCQESIYTFHLLICFLGIGGLLSFKFKIVWHRR